MYSTGHGSLTEASRYLPPAAAFVEARRPISQE